MCDCQCAIVYQLMCVSVGWCCVSACYMEQLKLCDCVSACYCTMFWCPVCECDGVSICCLCQCAVMCNVLVCMDEMVCPYDCVCVTLGLYRCQNDVLSGRTVNRLCHCTVVLVRLYVLV